MPAARRKPAPVSTRPNTAAFLLAEDRIRRARAGDRTIDPSGEHHASLSALAKLCGRDVVALVEEFTARASAREFDAGIPRAMAERLACDDVIAAYTPQKGLDV